MTEAEQMSRVMTSCSSSATEAGGVSGGVSGSGGGSAAPVMSLSDCQSVVVSQQQTRPVVFGDLLSSMHREVTYLLTYLPYFILFSRSVRILESPGI